MAEDRHRIEQNELAIWLGKVFAWLRPYARPLAWAGAIVLLLVIVGALWRSSRGAAAAQASVALAQALAQGSPGALEDVAREHGGTVGQLAQLAAADLYFSEGCHQLFINKTVARQDLQKALELYREVEKSARTPEIRAHAIFGVARTLEALSGTEGGQGLLREAVEKYQEVVQAFPTHPFAFFAQQRLSHLELEETKRFYDRFAKFDPRPPLQPEPPAGTTFPDSGLTPPPEPAQTPTGAAAPQEDSATSATLPLPPLVAPGEATAEPQGTTEVPAGAPAEAAGETQQPQDSPSAAADMSTGDAAAVNE